MKGTKELVKAERPSMLLSPFEELERMERWFEDVFSRPFSMLRSPMWGQRLAEVEHISPSFDIYEQGKELFMKADLPGVRKEDLTIDIDEHYLTVSGEKKKEEKVERENYYRFERSYGSFSRRFELPEGFDTDKAKAHFENGVLEVRIPKSEEAVRKSKKITID